jgi:hypothetical protein
LTSAAVTIDNDVAETRSKERSVRGSYAGRHDGGRGRGRGPAERGGRGNFGRGDNAFRFNNDRLTFDQLLQQPHSYITHERFQALSADERLALSNARKNVPYPTQAEGARQKARPKISSNNISN